MHLLSSAVAGALDLHAGMPGACVRHAVRGIRGGLFLATLLSATPHRSLAVGVVCVCVSASVLAAPPAVAAVVVG